MSNKYEEFEHLPTRVLARPVRERGVIKTDDGNKIFVDIGDMELFDPETGERWKNTRGNWKRRYKPVTDGARAMWSALFEDDHR